MKKENENYMNSAELSTFTGLPSDEFAIPAEMEENLPDEFFEDYSTQNQSEFTDSSYFLTDEDLYSEENDMNEPEEILYEDDCVIPMDEFYGNISEASEENNGTDTGVFVPKDTLTDYLRTLSLAYPKQIENLKREWVDNRAKIGGTEEEYILKKLPDRLQKSKKTFEDFDREHSDEALLERFLHPVNKEKQVVQTGFAQLDKLLMPDVARPGFLPGLHIIGGAPGIGKTAFLTHLSMNIANDAKMPRKVLLFELELSKDRMFARRASFVSKKHTDSEYTSTKIFSMSEKVLSSWSLDSQDKYRSVLKQTVKMSKNIRTFSAEEKQFTVDDIINGTKFMMKEMDPEEPKPVVIIDYLQIIETDPKDYRSDAEKIKSSLKKLKAFSVENDIVIIIISLLSRAYYFKPLGMEAFKETGSIEYDATTLIGLQYYGVWDQHFSLCKALSANPRLVEAVILKNRDGCLPAEPIYLKSDLGHNVIEVLSKGDAAEYAINCGLPKMPKEEPEKNHTGSDDNTTGFSKRKKSGFSY